MIQTLLCDYQLTSLSDLCLTSNLYLYAVTVDFTGFIVIRHVILSFQLIQSLRSHPSFTLCNHCGYGTDVCACRHTGFIIRCGLARGCFLGGEISHLIDIKNLSCVRCDSVSLLLKCHIVTWWVSCTPMVSKHIFSLVIAYFERFKDVFMY